MNMIFVITLYKKKFLTRQRLYVKNKSHTFGFLPV